MSEHSCKGTPLARCEVCRDDPHGCPFGFRATSPMPELGEKDCELHLGRTTIYALMEKLQNGVPIIEFAELGGIRVMAGASKCRYDAELTSNALGFNVLTAHQKNFNYFIKSHADRFQRFIIPSGVMKMNETLTDGNSDCTETNKLRASAYFGAGVTTIESWLQQGIVVEHLDEVDQMDTTMPNDKMRGSHRYGGGLPQRDDHHES